MADSPGCVGSGTTMVVDMVVPDKEETLMEAFEKCRKWADDKVEFFH